MSRNADKKFWSFFFTGLGFLAMGRYLSVSDRVVNWRETGLATTTIAGILVGFAMAVLWYEMGQNHMVKEIVAIFTVGLSLRCQLEDFAIMVGDIDHQSQRILIGNLDDSMDLDCFVAIYVRPQKTSIRYSNGHTSDFDSTNKTGLLAEIANIQAYLSAESAALRFASLSR